MQTRVPVRSILTWVRQRYGASHRVPFGCCFKNSLLVFFFSKDFESRNSVSLNLRWRAG